MTDIQSADNSSERSRSADTQDNEKVVLRFYEKTRSIIEHEDELISHRINWFLQFHGFLFAAFGFTFAPEATLKIAKQTNDGTLHILYVSRAIIVGAGVLTSFIVQLGTAAAYDAITNRVHQFWLKIESMIGKRSETLRVKFLEDRGLPPIDNVGGVFLAGLSPSVVLPAAGCVIWGLIGWKTAVGYSKPIAFISAAILLINIGLATVVWNSRSAKARILDPNSNHYRDAIVKIFAAIVILVLLWQILQLISSQNWLGGSSPAIRAASIPATKP